MVRIEPRGRPGVVIRFAVPVASVLAAAIVGAVVLLLSGHSPISAYSRMVDSAFGGSLSIIGTLVLASPLILTALAAAVAFRMGLWNIGGEGQFIMGAIVASGLALALGDRLPAPFVLVLVMLGGIVGGAVWAAVAAVPRAYLGTNEIIVTLMLNFVALQLMNYLIFGSASFWRDRGTTIFQGRSIPERAELPQIWGRLHMGIIIAVAMALLVWWLVKGTRWGYELRVIGSSPRTARYAGMKVGRKIIAVLAVSGALAGLAGGMEVSGVSRALDPRSLATNVGFTGIVVAAVARLGPLGIVPAAILIAALLKSGPSLQLLGIPLAIVLLLQGVILLCVGAGEFLLNYRMRLGRVALEPAKASE